MIQANLSHQQKSINLSFTPHNIKCPGNNISKQLCINESCHEKIVFTCLNLSCKCQVNHEKCHKCDLSYVVGQISSKLSNPTAEIYSFINKKFDQLIDNVSECRNNILIKISELERESNFSMLSDEECKFLEVLQDEQNEREFVGKEARKVWDAIKGNKNRNIRLFNDIMKELERYEQQSRVDLQVLTKNMNEAYLKFQRTEKLQLLKRTLKLPKLKVTPVDLFIKGSAIVKTQQQADTLMNFFKGQVKDIKLLFKASDNNFCISFYFKICGAVPNTLIICLTNKDKIIGGYSPLPNGYTGKGYEKQEYGEYEHDASRESFMFSLSNGDKFELKKQFRAIFRAKDYSSICFGTGQLKIGDKADKEMTGRTMLSKNYHNPKYRKTDPKFYEMMNGNDTEAFSTKQWEVWEIHIKK